MTWPQVGSVADAGKVFGLRGTWFGDETNDGVWYTAGLNFGGYCWGVCIATGLYRCGTAVSAFFSPSEEKAQTMGGDSMIFLGAQFCRGVGEVLHLGWILGIIDGVVIAIRVFSAHLITSAEDSY